MIKVLKALLITAVVSMATLVAGMTYMNSPAGGSPENTIFTIQQGESSFDIARHLKEQNFIRSSTYFTAMSYFGNYYKNFKAGRFKISGSMTTSDILEYLSTGELLQKTYRITIPEGFTAEETAVRYDENGLCETKDFMSIVRDPEGHGIDTHGHKLASLEGFLFPETYFFDERSTCVSMVRRMVDQFFEVFGEREIARANETGFSLTEAVTLASLIEEEAKVESERPLISGVLQNRLSRGIMLQCDATVQYALPRRKGRLFYKDLKVDSPYNTYKNAGLPPGPICNPGRTSLRAAIYPAKSNFLFYVAKGDGAHIFSRTAEEHNRAKIEAQKSRVNN